MMSLTPDRLVRGIEQEQNKIGEGAKSNKTKTKFVPIYAPSNGLWSWRTSYIVHGLAHRAFGKARDTVKRSHHKCTFPKQYWMKEAKEQNGEEAVKQGKDNNHRYQ
jgi:hypothetical protein